MVCKIWNLLWERTFHWNTRIFSSLQLIPFWVEWVLLIYEVLSFESFFQFLEMGSGCPVNFFEQWAKKLSNAIESLPPFNERLFESCRNSCSTSLSVSVAGMILAMDVKLPILKYEWFAVRYVIKIAYVNQKSIFDISR